MTGGDRRHAGRALGAAAVLALAVLLAACASDRATRPPDLAELQIEVDCDVFPSATPKAQFVAFDDYSLKLRLLREAAAATRSSDSGFPEDLNNGFPISRDTVLSWIAVNYARLGAYDHAFRVTGDLEERRPKRSAVAGIASLYATQGEIEEARKLTLSLTQGSPWHAWEHDTMSIYVAAALVRRGDVAAARQKLRDLGIEDSEIDWRIAPWLVDAGRAEEALALLRDATELSPRTHAQAFAAVSQAAFRSGNAWAGREAALEAHRVRRDAGYTLLGVAFVDIPEHLGLVDLLYSEEEDAAASVVSGELTEDLIGLGDSDPTDDAMMFEFLLYLFELQRSYGDLEGALRSLKAIRRRAAANPDAEEHWARVAATRKVWTMVMDGQVKSGLRLAESLGRPRAQCSALGNVVSALSSRGDFPRAWQVAEATLAEGDCGLSEPASGFDDYYFPIPPPFSSIALIALSKGDPQTACRALERIEDKVALVLTVSQMVGGLARAGYLDLAAEVAGAIDSKEFWIIAVLDAIDPRPIGPRAGLPLRNWWGEPLPYR